MKVGFVGLGKMGQGMALRIAAAGHDLIVFNRTRSKLSVLDRPGVTIAESIADLASQVEVVVSMLADDAALAAVAVQGEGVVASLPKGRIHVAMGTHGVAAVRDLDRLHVAAGQAFVCAPVIGRPDRAAAGALAITAGGPAEAMRKCKPLFEAMGNRLYEVGSDPASAAAIKLANNFVLGCAIEAIGEAFTMARKYEVDPALMNAVLTEVLFDCVAYKGYGATILGRTFDPALHKVVTGLKDIDLALAAAEAVGAPLPSAYACRDRLIGAIAHGDGQRDWSIVAVEQARASGLE